MRYSQGLSQGAFYCPRMKVVCGDECLYESMVQGINWCIAVGKT
jgi:hypothetical protein